MIRAAILGCGRIGAGIGWEGMSLYLYDHASAYMALKDRVELRWVFDPDPSKAWRAGRKFGVPDYTAEDWRWGLRTAMKERPVDLVSVCTPPGHGREDLYAELAQYNISGAWIEKPLGAPVPDRWLVNVNYIRRFDPAHQELAALGTVRELRVWAKRDIHTVCHFTDLARFWGVVRDRLIYHEIGGGNSYEAIMADGSSRLFPVGGIQAGSPFMTNALGNLLDAMDGTAAPLSSAANARESEAWADEILRAA